MTQKGYLIVEAKVSDPEAYEIYKGLAQAAIAQYGGRYLVRGGAVEILEGKWTNTAAIWSLSSLNRWNRRSVFINSPEYQAARQSRERAAEMNMLVVAGIENLI